MDTSRDLDPAELSAGQLLHETYMVVRPLARGGMGRLYEVEHARLSGRYALKLIAPELSRDREILDRFRREAEIASGLRHPGIVQVIDFNTTSTGQQYLVMELLEGEDLKARLRRGGVMGLAEVASVVKQVASALAAAHSRGVVHRDLKPENIFLTRVPGGGEPLVKVLDFGISKIKAATTRLTGPDRVMGTPHYMSPEQACGRLDSIDERTDQFALAAIAYEMLTGAEAFRGDSASAVLYQVVHEIPEALCRESRAIPARLKPVLLRGLAKTPGERYPSVHELSRAFDAAAADELGVPRGGLHDLSSAGGARMKPRTLTGLQWWLSVALRLVLLAGGVLGGIFGVLAIRAKVRGPKPVPAVLVAAPPAAAIPAPPAPVAAPLPAEPAPALEPEPVPAARAKAGRAKKTKNRKSLRPYDDL